MTALSSTSIQINWTAPSPPNGELGGFKVFLTDNLGQISQVASGLETEVTVENLKPFTEYKAVVESFNVGFESEPTLSEEVSVTTLEEGN